LLSPITTHLSHIEDVILNILHTPYSEA